MIHARLAPAFDWGFCFGPAPRSQAIAKPTGPINVASSASAFELLIWWTVPAPDNELR